jgi:lipopolysaccharide/colanic/teichoic acid biosynthesis glycosyltransferase
MAERDLLDAAPPTADGVVERAPARRLLGRLNQRGFRLVMVADAVALYAIAVGLMLLRYGTEWPTYPVALYLVSFAVATAIFLAAVYFGGLYEREPRLGAPPALPRAARQTLVAGGMIALLNLGLTGFAREIGLTTERALPFPTQNLIAFIVLGAAVIAANRRLVHLRRTGREGPPKVALVGTPEALETARQHLSIDAERASVVGEVADLARLSEELERTHATDVLLLTGDWLDRLYPDRLEDLERRGITVLLRVSGRETMYGLERVREVGGLPFVLLRSQTMPRSRARFKRVFDLFMLLGTAPLWLPVLGLTSLYQLVAAGRPLLYWQERVGAGGRTFRLVKFRTMPVDAEADGLGPRLADLDDPRIIPACRWIRATRLDELPQLWNVLRGEMSLVGPRPERPELTAEFERAIPGYRRRYEVPPGLTGLAQIHGRYHTDAEYKLGYDLQYLVNWSPVLDLEIMARTLWVILTRKL